MTESLKFTDTGSYEEFATMEIDRLRKRVEQLESGPGGIMEMKQTIADREREIEYLQADLRFWQERYTHYTTTLQAEVDRLQKDLDLADTVVHNLKWAEKFYPDIFDETLAKLFGHEEKK